MSIEEEERKYFNLTEISIIREFEGGISIRKLTEKYEGFGRTRINNILRRYAKIFPENSDKINNQLIGNKTHKTEDEVKKAKEQKDLTDDEVQAFLSQVKMGRSLTSISIETGRTRDYIKKRILDLLENEEEKNEFLEALQENQKGQNKFEELLEAEDPIKFEIIFNKLNGRRIKAKRPVYSYLMMTRKFVRLKQYLLSDRNSRIDEAEAKLTEKDFWFMLFDTPTLLAGSLSDKIKPALENLDKHPNVGMKNATKIIRDDGSILFSSINRTNLQLKILEDYDFLEEFFERPRSFRTSPELMYALMQFHGTKTGKPTGNVFLSKKQLLDRFGITTETLISEFDIRKEYGDDEYFDGR